jgi:ABC-type oligopeptide transport system substrate-binding subunit/predicted Ser/Thr protein kinase
MIGSLLNNRYKIDSELGQGGMGVVYRGHDNLLRRDVAVKLIEKSSLGTEGRARLLHEARAAAALNHPNVVSIFDAGEADNTPFIVMELVDGRSLHSHHTEDFDEIVHIAQQICVALGHAHAHGVIHRDLKPENVLIARNGTAILTDFGLARSVASRLSSEGMIVGTVFYLAPELARGQDYDGRADLYALGVMLYELTTGELPFTSDDPLAVISQHLNAPVIPPRAKNPAIRPALERLILGLMAKDPADRPSSATEVLHRLENLEGDSQGASIAGELSVLDRIVRGRLVGRDRELAEAIALWQAAASAKGQVLLVSGEPGVGKTRLVKELCARVEISGGEVLASECYAEGNTPYTPFSQIIRSSLENGQNLKLSKAVLKDLVTIAPDLEIRYPEKLPAPSSDPEGQQLHLFESVFSLLNAILDKAPILLFLDDGHWADSGTLQLLRHLARRTRDRRMMIVTTYREIELDETRPFLAFIHDLNRERLATRLKLTRLDSQGAEDMLAALLAEKITPDFLEGIYRETEGNPFFIEEVIKALVEQGELFYDDNRWHRPSMEEIKIPQSVHLAIHARVGKLPAAAQDVLQQAAIFGREFDYESLKLMSTLNEDVLIEALERAERAQLIEEIRHKDNGRRSGSPAFSFAHALIPTSLYENVSSLRRPRLHHRAALALEQVHALRLEAIAPRLGRHFAEAGETKKAVEYLIKAGDKARDLYAYQEAIDAYQQALELMRDIGELSQAARTQMKLGLLYHTTFDYARARQAYKEGFALWRQAGEERDETHIPAAPHAFRVTWEYPPTLDPGLAIDSASATAIYQIFHGLVELNPDMEIMPDIAHTWEVQEGGRKYIFRLREDVRWSDDTPVTAGDFAYAWKRVLDPETGSRAAEWLYDLKGARAYHQGELAEADEMGVRALDDYTLLVELEEPAGYFLHLLAFFTSFPVPRHFVEEYGERWTDLGHIVTNGPFKIKSRQHGKQILLTRNPNFTGRHGGNLEEIELNLVRGLSPKNLKWYEADDLDMIGIDSQLQVFDQARRRYADEYVTGPGFVTTCVGFDPSRPPFDDERVRQAFVHAADRDYLANVVARGYVDPATGGFVPPGIPGHSEGIGLTHDVERARQLLEAAGYPDGKGFPKITTPIWSSYASTCEYLQGQWSQNLGVEVDLESMEWAAYLDTLHEEPPQLMWLGWSADYPDPDGFLRVPFSRYRSLMWDDTYRDLVESARRVTEQADRMKMYQDADRYLITRALVMPLTYGRWHLLVKPWVKKLPLSPFAGGIYFKDIVLAPH